MAPPPSSSFVPVEETPDPKTYYHPRSTVFMLFTVNHVIILFLLYALAQAFQRAVQRLYASRLPTQTLSTFQLRNCTAYFLKAVFATVALGLQLSSGRVLQFEFSGTKVSDLKLVQLVSLLVADLCLFELIYRVRMQRPLIVYNLVLAGVLVFAAYVYDKTLNLYIYQLLFIFLIQATTDQLLSVSLLAHRLRYSWSVSMLYFSAVQVFGIRLVSVIWSFYCWAKHFVHNNDDGITDHRSIKLAWNVLFPISCIILLLVHAWTAYTTWMIARNAHMPERQCHRRRCNRGISTKDDLLSEPPSEKVSLCLEEADVKVAPAHDTSAAFERSDFFAAITEPQVAIVHDKKVKGLQ